MRKCKIVAAELLGYTFIGQHAYRATLLQSYAATELQDYMPTRIAKQRGARNGTPQDGESLFLFSSEGFQDPSSNRSSAATADFQTESDGHLPPLGKRWTSPATRKAMDISRHSEGDAHR